jgi:ABC-type spermidine/putrescine transport system permease subunit II
MTYFHDSLSLMPTWKPDFRRNRYLTIHFYLSVLMSVVLLGVSLFLFVQRKDAVQGAWALALAVVLIGSVPGVIVPDSQEKESA